MLVSGEFVSSIRSSEKNWLPGGELVLVERLHWLLVAIWVPRIWVEQASDKSARDLAGAWDELQRRDRAREFRAGGAKRARPLRRNSN